MHRSKNIVVIKLTTDSARSTGRKKSRVMASIHRQPISCHKKTVVPQQTTKLKNKDFIDCINCLTMATEKKRKACVSAAKKIKAAGSGSKKPRTASTTAKSASKKGQSSKTTSTTKSSTAKTALAKTAPDNDDAYPSPKDKGFHQHLFGPDRIKTEEDWYDYNYYVAPKNLPPPWESKDSKRVYCSVCLFMYHKTLSNSIAIKNHCEQASHQENMKKNPLTKIIVNGKTVKSVDAAGNKIVGQIKISGIGIVKQNFSEIRNPNPNF